MDKSNGPDLVPARILNHCALQLALPIVLLARLCFSQGRWPRIWSSHWVAPIFKRGSVHDPGKYRGVHLTSVVSKVVERLPAKTFVSFLDGARAFLAIRSGRFVRSTAVEIRSRYLRAHGFFLWNLVAWLGFFSVIFLGPSTESVPTSCS